MKLKVTNRVIYWKGPSPFYFLPIPELESADIKGISGLITYGWGVIPATIKIDETEFKTALFPKNNKYLVPLKKTIRESEQIDEGDTITLTVELSF